MAHSPPSILPGSELPPSNGAGSKSSVTSSANRQPDPDPISSLRHSLSKGSESPAAILYAIPDVVRALTGADGVAVAVRTQGVVVCRARSGEVAPDVGALLNVDSGISGACLRTGDILLCVDAATDDRVDPEVCAVLGIRSILAVPLFGPTGIAGILEAFSTTPSAFGDDEINVLRELAEVAEAAHEQECLARDGAAAGPAPRRQIFPASRSNAGKTSDGQTDTDDESGEAELVPRRRYWMLAFASLALLLMAGVVWLSWRDPTPEVAASEAIAQPLRPPQKPTAVPLNLVPPKPEAGIANHHVVPSQVPSSQVTTSKVEPSKTAGVLQNAAQIQPAEGSDPSQGSVSFESRDVPAPAASPDSTNDSASSLPASNQPASNQSASNEPAPSVEIASSSEPGLLSGIASGATTMPELDAKVSQGLRQGVLMHQVRPAYPAQAWAQRLAGSVVLDATIGQDGNVLDLKLVSGAPLLAAAAKDAVRQWRYSPALLNGVPIEVQKRITVVFKLP